MNWHRGGRRIFILLTLAYAGVAIFFVGQEAAAAFFNKCSEPDAAYLAALNEVRQAENVKLEAERQRCEQKLDDAYRAESAKGSLAQTLDSIDKFDKLRASCLGGAAPDSERWFAEGQASRKRMPEPKYRNVLQKSLCAVSTSGAPRLGLLFALAYVLALGVLRALVWVARGFQPDRE